MEPFIAQIILFGGNFAPRGWAFCDGQLLPINQNQALFSLLGTTYGGDGRTSFALPDLRSRAALHDGSGSGAGLSSYQLGQAGGNETTTLQAANLPSHNHVATLRGSVAEGDQSAPGGNLIAVANDGEENFVSPGGAGTLVNTSSSQVVVGNTGSNVAFNNRQPYLALNYIIALQGIFPSRN